ncbi:MAG: vitamin B12 transporter, partial [Verrucomicrobia bacterium]
LSSGSDGTRVKESLVSALRLDKDALASTLTLAIDNKRETYLNIPIGAATSINTKRVLNNTGYVAEYDATVGDHFGFGAALRHDQNDRFKNADTYRIQASWRFNTGLRLRAASGSGITAPTNFELFGYDPTSFVGNPNLKPEKSKGWEAGLDWFAPNSPVRLGATWFSDILTGEIQTNFTPSFLSTPVNLAQPSYQHGLELTAAADLPGSVTLDGAYTHLKATEKGGLTEVRRPDDTASLNATWRGQKVSVTGTVRYTGKFVDFDFTNPFGAATRRAMPAFTLVNVAAAYKLAPRVELTARVENLFNAKYQEVFTFQAQGVSAFVGLRAGF